MQTMELANSNEGSIASGCKGAFIVLTLGLAIGSSTAQPSQPDVYSVESNGVGETEVYRYGWSGGVTYQKSLLYSSAGLGYGALLDVDNQSTLVVRSGMNMVLVLSITPDGIVSTVFAHSAIQGNLTIGIALPEVHQSGNFAFSKTTQYPSGRRTYGLCTGDRTGTTLSTLAEWDTVDFESTDLIQDVVSGDYYVAERFSGFNSPALFRITESGAVSTVIPRGTIPTFLNYNDWDQNPWTGEFVGTSWFGWPQYPYGPPGLQGSLWTRFRFVPWTPPVLLHSQRDLEQTFAVHEGRWLVGLHSPIMSPTPWSVIMVPYTGGTPVMYPASPPTPGSFTPAVLGQIALRGRRKVVGRGPATPGTDYSLSLNFPGEAGRGYQAGASFGIQPGMTIGGKGVPLNLDPLFLLSLTNPAIFQGFSGALDSGARASATVRLPPSPGLRGLRVFFAALTYDGGGIRVVSDPIGMTVL